MNSAQVKPIPEGYHTVTPYLVAEDAEALMRFIQQAFETPPPQRHDRPDGSLMHAEMRIGDSPVMLCQACDKAPAMPTMLYLYVEDADAWYTRATTAGGESIMEPTDMFWGDRCGAVKDPCGNTWWIGTHIENVTPEELNQRAQAQAQC